tara:strand:- start:33 stop:566 length:534 start_codon:yes stop_codon:yes gene_type:complete
METNLNKNSLDIGVKLGTLLFFITAIIYILDINYFSNFLLMLSVYRIPVIAFGIYAVISNKKLNKGFLSFKEAFTSYFWCIVVGYFILNLGSILIFKFIDPTSAQIINQNMTPAVLEFMHTINSYVYLFPPEAFDMTIENMRNFDGFSYSNIISEFFKRLLMNAIFAVPVAFIFKKS